MEKYQWIGKKIRHVFGPVKGGTRSMKYCRAANEGMIADDTVICDCGYIRCSGEGPCAPESRCADCHSAEGPLQKAGDGLYYCVNGRDCYNRVWPAPEPPPPDGKTTVHWREGLHGDLEGLAAALAAPPDPPPPDSTPVTDEDRELANQLFAEMNGWRHLGGDSWIHESGAHVHRTAHYPEGRQWFWLRPGSWDCEEPRGCREDAMVAALSDPPNPDALLRELLEDTDDEPETTGDRPAAPAPAQEWEHTQCMEGGRVTDIYKHPSGARVWHHTKHGVPTGEWHFAFDEEIGAYEDIGVYSSLGYRTCLEDALRDALEAAGVKACWWCRETQNLREAGGGRWSCNDPEACTVRGTPKLAPGGHSEAT